MSKMSSERQSKAIMVSFIAIWANWPHASEDVSDDALRLLCETARCGGANSPALNYFVAAYLDDVNPRDLTYCEMFEAMQVEVTG
jgi:hypothetical protein